ncbi:MAG: ABC transporter transmembrane domain-containing protein [Pseudomonadota bacterium]
MKETKINTYFRLLSYLFRHTSAFIGGLAGTVIASLAASSFAWFLKPLLNKGFISPDPHFIHWLPVIAIAITCITGIGGFVGDYLMARVSRGVVMDLQKELFERLLRMPLSFFERTPSSRVIAVLIYNIEQVTQACTSALLTIVRDGAFLIGLTTVMFINSWPLALIFLVTLPAILLTFRYIAAHLHRISLQIQNAISNVSHSAEASLMYHQKASHSAESIGAQKQFLSAIQQVWSQQIWLALVNGLGSTAIRIIASLSVAIAIFVSTATHYTISAGAFISTISAMLAAAKPIRQLSEVNSDIQKGIAGAESVFEVLDHPA